MLLKNKVAIVTGSARGIGQAIALEFAKEGCDVVVSDIIEGSETVKKIKQLKRDCIFVRTDFTKKEEIEKLFQQTINKFKKLDILVNNAGIALTGPTISFSDEEWEKTMNVNLRGYFWCCREALKHIKTGSCIINISSVAGISGAPNSLAYCSSKGGVRLLTKSLASELGKKGIRVNSIHPGLIKTKMTEDIINDKKYKEEMLKKIPLKRIGEPVDIARPAVFLASDMSLYINGEELVVDGGWISSL